MFVLRLNPSWLFLAMISACIQCVSDPEPVLNRSLPESPSSLAVIPEPPDTLEDGYGVNVVGSKTFLSALSSKEASLAKGPLPLLSGSFLLGDQPYLETLKLDMRRTGENDYFFFPSSHSNPGWIRNGPAPLGASLLGDLWRGDPRKGGVLIVQGLGLSQVVLHRFETKRPIPRAFQNQVFALVSTEFEMVAIPLFGHNELNYRRLRLRLKELRGHPEFRAALIKEPHMVVFDGPNQVSNKEMVLRAKIRIQGKFYTSAFERITTAP